jgi:uncharacterized membrane-anchored protein
MKNIICAVILLSAFTFQVAAQKPKKEKVKLSPEEQKMFDDYTKLGETEKSLKFETGKISIKDNLATLNLNEKYRYLNPQETEKVLHDLWNNPPNQKTLGMIVPKNLSLLDENSWGVIITYTDDGHVADDDAGSINYDDLLKSMQEDTRQDSEDRKKQGYAPLELVGWAASPHYDNATRKLYWAQNLKNTESGESSLNYDVRVLGRTGVLSLNAIASMKNLSQIETDMKEVLTLADFNQGNRYEDFNSGTDNVAAYGIGALVAGKVLAKVGFFAVALKFLAVSWKFIAFGAVGLLSWLGKVFFGRKSDG